MIKKDVDVVAYLLENKQAYTNIRMIAQDLKLDYKNAHLIIKRLEKDGIITIESIGKSKKICLGKSLNPTIYEAEDVRKYKVFSNKNLKAVYNHILGYAKSKLFVCLLFGSYASNKNTKASDIDLLVIVPDENAEKDMHSIISLLPSNYDVHANIFTEKEFISMKNSKQDTVVSEAMKNNIVLYGIEMYYLLIQ